MDTLREVIREKEDRVNNTYRFTVRKHTVNKEVTHDKKAALELLRKCHYRTPPIEIASYLHQILNNPETHEGHWEKIARMWTPRSINQVLNIVIRHYKTGEAGNYSGGTPAKYFTFLIKKREKRKKYRKEKDKKKENSDSSLVQRQETTGVCLDDEIKKYFNETKNQ